MLLAACSPPQQGSPPPPAPDVGAEVVGDGTVSTTGANEYNPSLAPDGRTLVFARSEADFRNAKIHLSYRRGEQWSEAEPIGFSDPRYTDSDPTLSPDGRTLYFISDRPAPGREAGRTDLDIWKADREGDGWSDPVHLGPSVNTPAQELGPAWHDGWLYFASSRGGRASMLDLYRARAAGGGFDAAQPLEQWNTAASESDPELSADGTQLLFWSDRPGGQGGGDVYRSERVGAGWSEAVRLQGPINSAGFDFTPTFAPDGKWIYFASTRSRPGEPDGGAQGDSNLYRLRSEAVLPR